MPSVWFTFVVLALAVARVTRLVTIDTITSPLRVRWFKRFPPRATTDYSAHYLGILVSCPFCVSVHVAAVLTAATAATVGIPRPWLVWPAVASLAGWGVHWLDRE